jgi:hypothetical protein
MKQDSIQPHFRIFYSLIFSAVLLFCTGCGLRPSLQAPDASQAPAYRPPTLAVKEPTPTAEPTQPVEIVPTPTITCTDQLTYVSDLTVPDGTVVVPDATIDKRWEVENSGTCNWNENYHLRQINEPDLGMPKEQALYPARSGSRANLRVVLTAPTKPGKYHIIWQAANPAGQLFGDPIYMDIVVSEP